MANIKIEQVSKELSSRGGLFLLEKLFRGSRIDQKVAKYLPSLKSGTKRSS